MIESGATLQVFWRHGGPKGPLRGAGAAREPDPSRRADHLGAGQHQVELYLDADVTLPSNMRTVNGSTTSPHRLRIWTHSHECRFALQAEAAAMSMQCPRRMRRTGVIQARRRGRASRGWAAWHQDRTGTAPPGRGVVGIQLCRNWSFGLTTRDGPAAKGIRSTSVDRCGCGRITASAVDLKHGQGECRMEHSSFQGRLDPARPRQGAVAVLCIL